MDDRTRRRLFEKGTGKIEQRIKAKTYKCLVPECLQTAIRSHSQQREVQLRSIARDGKVYALDRNMYRAGKRRNHDALASMRLQGIRETSTYPGFCGTHDQALFQCLDQADESMLGAEQAWALFLRTFGYEFAQKRRSFDTHSEFQALMSSLDDPYNQKISQIHQAGVGNMLTRDAPEYFRRLWQARDQAGFPGIAHYQRTVSGNLGLSTSCMLSPLYGEARLRGYLSEWQPLVAFNIIPSLSRTLISVSALSEHAALAQSLVDRLLADDRTLEALIDECSFVESEDTCVNPTLWESLDDSVRQAVLKAMEHEMHRGPLSDPPRVIAIGR